MQRQGLILWTGEWMDTFFFGNASSRNNISAHSLIWFFRLVRVSWESSRTNWSVRLRVSCTRTSSGRHPSRTSHPHLEKFQIQYRCKNPQISLDFYFHKKYQRFLRKQTIATVNFLKVFYFLTTITFYKQKILLTHLLVSFFPWKVGGRDQVAQAAGTAASTCTQKGSPPGLPACGCSGHWAKLTPRTWRPKKKQLAIQIQSSRWTHVNRGSAWAATCIAWKKLALRGTRNSTSALMSLAGSAPRCAHRV